MKISVGTILKVKVEGVGSFGEGLARHEDQEIFIPKSVTRDVVEVKIVEFKKGRARAELLKILEPSPFREKPQCRHFDYCGGCDFQHIRYEEQLAWKLRITKHWIRRSPLAPYLDQIHFETIESPTPYGYRQRVRLQVRNGKLHYFKPHSNELFPIEECPILESQFFEKLGAEASNLGTQKDWSRTARHRYEIAGHALEFSDKCFTQANLEVNRRIWEQIENYAQTLSLRRKALDLYCGIGNFSIPLKDHFDSVTGVEVEGESIQFARLNSNQVNWISKTSELAIDDFIRDREFFDFVVLDPPRPGARKVCAGLLELRAPEIAYVSCNLETLIADLVLLMKSKRYRIRRWLVCDMFPHTRHIESVVILSSS